MNAARFRRLSELFERGRHLAAADRDALLIEVRSSDSSLADELAGLLSAHADSAGVLGEDPDRRPPMAGESFGPFRLMSALGDGGMGTVYRAVAVGDGDGWNSGETVAVKLLHGASLDSPRRRARFEREISLGASVVHPNVVRTFGGGTADFGGRPMPYLVMEYVEGQTLQQLVGELAAVPEELCRHVAREVARGLSALHAAGIVHRDVKPANVIVTTDHCVKLMDLGVAQASRFSERLSRTGGFAGTLAYAAPEQFRDAGVDARADLFALGAVLYELASGDGPFAGEDFAATMARVTSHEPPPLDVVSLCTSPLFSAHVEWLLEKRRESRPASAAAFIEALDAGADGPWWRERRASTGEADMRRRIAVARDTGVHGRDIELRELRTAFDTAAGATGTVVLVTGEAGIGKSRLVDEFVARLHREGCEHALLYASHTSGDGLRQAFADCLAIPATARVVEDAWAEREGLGAAFRDFVSHGAGVDAAAVQTAVVEAVRALSARAPVVLVVDDLHAADERSRTLFASLAAGTRRERVLLVGTHRAEHGDAWAAQLSTMGWSQTLRLRRLGPKDLAELLRDAFRSERLARELALPIAEKTDGNPYFVVEVVRSLRDQNLVSRSTDGSWTATSVLRDIEVPETVRETVAARLDDLADEDRDLLDVAACIGNRFDAELAAAVHGATLLAVLRALARIERRHRLVRSAREQFEFDHPQVRDVLYRALSPALRRELHRQIGVRLADAEGAIPAVTCRHLFLGGESVRAAAFLDPALDDLADRGLHEESVELGELALGVEDLLAPRDRIALLVRIQHHLEVVGRGDDAVAALDRAVELANAIEDTEAALRARLERAAVLRLHGEFDAALVELAEVRAEAGRRGLAELETDALVGAGDVHVQRAQFDDAMANLQEARNRVADEGRHDLLLKLTLQVINVLIRFQRFDEAMTLIDETLPAARSSGPSSTLGRLESARGLALRSVGRIEECIDAFGKSEAIGREIGDRRMEAAAIGNLANTYARTGRLRDALPLLERVGALFEDLGDANGIISATLNRSNVLGQLGRFAESLEISARGIDVARRVGDLVSLANLLGSAGSVNYELGRFATSVPLHRERVELLQRSDHVVFEAIGRADLAEALAALGLIEEAEEQYTKAVELADVAPHPYSRSRAFNTYASFLLGRGRLAEAAECAGVSIDVAEELGDALLLAHGLVIRGLARSELEDISRAVEVSRAHDTATMLVVSTAHLTEVRGGDVAAARSVLREYRPRVDALSRIQVLSSLVRTAGADPVRVELAAELREEIERLLAANPAEYHERMRAHSPWLREALELI